MVWPLEYDGKPIESAGEIGENWKFVYQSRFNNGVVYGISKELSVACAQRRADEISLTLFQKEWNGVVYRQGENVAMTLRSEDGETLWGIQE